MMYYEERNHGQGTKQKIFEVKVTMLSLLIESTFEEVL